MWKAGPSSQRRLPGKKLLVGRVGSDLPSRYGKDGHCYFHSPARDSSRRLGLTVSTKKISVLLEG